MSNNNNINKNIIIDSTQPKKLTYDKVVRIVMGDDESNDTSTTTNVTSQFKNHPLMKPETGKKKYNFIFA